MKKTEIIELNGKEYTLELNRDSFIQIDRACNVEKSFQIMYEDMYDYFDEAELDDNFNPNILIVDDEDLDKKIELKQKTLEKLVTRALVIWLYPNYQMPISEVKALLEPYFNDEEKAKELGYKVGQYIKECVDIRNDYIEERKNLKAQVNKK